MAWDKGQISRTSVLWLADDDLQHFSAALAQALPQLRWTCLHTCGLRQVTHAHESLAAASACVHTNPADPHVHHSGQARALLPVGEPGQAMGLLLVNPLVSYPQHIVPARDFGPSFDVAQLADYPKAFDSVRGASMGIRWNTHDGNEATCAAIAAQVKLVWRVLHRSTLPLVVRSLVHGTPMLSKRYRIGPHMAAQVRREGWCLQDGPFMVLE